MATALTLAERRGKARRLGYARSSQPPIVEATHGFVDLCKVKARLDIERRFEADPCENPKKPLSLHSTAARSAPELGA